MATLAIRGHATRGKEVIEILEMLGGVNKYEISAANVELLLYTIRGHDNSIIGVYPTSTFVVFTLEEFLEKFPYKIGDKVSSKYLKNYKIVKMEWEDTNNRAIYKLQGMGWYSSEELQPYKEETMDKVNKAVFDTNAQCCDISNKIIKKETMRKEISGAIVDRFICLEGYDFYDDKGNVIDTKEITMKKKQPKYPKTYEECYEILGLEDSIIEGCLGYEYKLLNAFQKLLMCRDAYWKIAAEKNKGNIDYVICNVGGKIINTNIPNSAYNHILTFPTEEIRDAFYENFKELIEECKELL